MRTCSIRLNAGEQNRFFFIRAKFMFTTYIKLAIFPKYRNSNDRSFHFRKKGITCSLAWEKYVRRSARFWRTIKENWFRHCPKKWTINCIRYNERLIKIRKGSSWNNMLWFNFTIRPTVLLIFVVRGMKCFS